jgi:hypothetical protein
MSLTSGMAAAVSRPSMSLAAAGLKMIINIFLNEQNQPFTYARRRSARPNPESRGIIIMFISKGKSSLSTPE